MDNAVDYSFINPYLAAGEHVLWYGKPSEGNLITRNDFLLIPFSIAWCGFAVFWTVSAASSGVPIFWLFGVPFVCVGLYLVFGRFIHTAYLRKRTVYVITSQKILRCRAGKIDMLMKASMPPMRVEIYKNGCGTIHFEHMHPYGRRSSLDSSFALENIADVTRAQQAITNMSNY